MLRYLTSVGFRRGALGGSRAWMIVGGAAAFMRILGRMASRQEKIVYCEKLEPGQSLLVSHLPDASRR